MLHRQRPGTGWIVAGLACLAATGAAQAETPTGRVGDALAYEQIANNQLMTAERTLEARDRRDARDPGRLINLGIVYGRTGRVDQAQAAFAAAASAPEEMLIAADGRNISSRDLAREGMAWVRSMPAR